MPDDKAIAVGLATAISRACTIAAEKAVRPIEMDDGHYGVGLYADGELKFSIPTDVERNRDETAKNIGLKQALNFFRVIFEAAIKSGLHELYGDMKDVSSQQLVDEFHRLLYECRHGLYSSNWFGTSIVKTPFDMMVYQELLVYFKPDLIIETGTMFGGSALFAANVCDLLNKGLIVSIDTEDRKPPQHSRIRYLLGSSVDDGIFGTVREACSGKGTVLVVLDSDHSKKHVLKEMEMYGKLVTVGSYMIVEDTNMNGHPVNTDASFGPGPWEAVEEYLKTHDEFKQDRSREHYPFTFNPGGYLQKVR